MIYKTFRGDRILFIGPKEEIIPLFNSAYNWGATDLMGKKDDFTDEDLLLDMGDFKGFSVAKRKITRWRINALLTKFDCDRLISRRLLKKLIRAVKNWLNSFEIIPQWQLRHEFSTYNFTISPTIKRIPSDYE